MSADQVKGIETTTTLKKFDPDTGDWKDADVLITGEYEIPPVGSRWFNNRRKKVFTVAGLVAHCEDEGAEVWEVLYRSDDMAEGRYRRRSVESWYGTNRDGQTRFVKVEQDEQVS